MKTRLQPVAALALCDLVLSVFAPLCVAAPSAPPKGKPPVVNSALTTPPFTKASLVGDYGYFRWGGSELHLRADGTFTQAQHHCMGTNYLYGSYTLKNGLLVLSPKYTNKDVELKPQDAWRGLLVTDQDLPQSFLPVRWGERIYLLQHTKEELAFCNSINLGEEPSSGYGNYCLRVEDVKKPVTGFPQMPALWNDYLIKTPIQGKVVRLADDVTAIVDVGRAEGLRVGMEFYSERLKNFFLFKVIAVQEHQASVLRYPSRVPFLVMGDEVSTRRKRSTSP